MITLTIEVDNVYGGETHSNVQAVAVPSPEPDIDLDDWANEVLFQFTGTGREGYAGYFVKITECANRPELVGHEFEWFG